MGCMALEVPFDDHFVKLLFGAMEKQHHMPGSMWRHQINLFLSLSFTLYYYYYYYGLFQDNIFL